MDGKPQSGQGFSVDCGTFSSDISLACLTIETQWIESRVRVTAPKLPNLGGEAAEMHHGLTYGGYDNVVHDLASFKC